MEKIEPKPRMGTEENGEEASVDGIRENGIHDTGSVLTGSKHLIHCLTIIGQIEGHYILPPQNKTTKYEHVIPQLAAIEESEEIKGLLVLLNTVGGDRDCRADRRDEKADGVGGAGRRPLHRRAAGRFGQGELYRPQRDDDHPSGADERPGAGGAPELLLL